MREKQHYYSVPQLKFWGRINFVADPTSYPPDHSSSPTFRMKSTPLVAAGSQLPHYVVLVLCNCFAWTQHQSQVFKPPKSLDFLGYTLFAEESFGQFRALLRRVMLLSKLIVATYRFTATGPRLGNGGGVGSWSEPDESN